MNLTSLLQDQPRIRRSMRPRASRCIQDQTKGPLYMTNLVQLPQHIRSRGHQQIEEQIMDTLWNQAWGNR